MGSGCRPIQRLTLLLQGAGRLGDHAGTYPCGPYPLLCRTVRLAHRGQGNRVSRAGGTARPSCVRDFSECPLCQRSACCSRSITARDGSRGPVHTGRLAWPCWPPLLAVRLPGGVHGAPRLLRVRATGARATTPPSRGDRLGASRAWGKRHVTTRRPRHAPCLSGVSPVTRMSAPGVPEPAITPRAACPARFPSSGPRPVRLGRGARYLRLTSFSGAGPAALRRSGRPSRLSHARRRVNVDAGHFSRPSDPGADRNVVGNLAASPPMTTAGVEPDALQRPTVGPLSFVLLPAHGGRTLVCWLCSVDCSDAAARLTRRVSAVNRAGHLRPRGARRPSLTRTPCGHGGPTSGLVPRGHRSTCGVAPAHAPRLSR